jgi:hypothetical protein
MVKHRRTHGPLVVALYINAGLIAAVLLVMLSRDSSMRILPATMAQNQLPIGGGAGVFIVPCQFAGGNYGVCLLDIDAQNLLAYQFYPGDKDKLKLVAARSFRYDRRLGHFNTGSPAPEEVKDWVAAEQAAIDRVLNAPAERPPVEAPPQN